MGNFSAYISKATMKWYLCSPGDTTICADKGKLPHNIQWWTLRNYFVGDTQGEFGDCAGHKLNNSYRCLRVAAMCILPSSFGHLQSFQLFRQNSIVWFHAQSSRKIPVRVSKSMSQLFINKNWTYICRTSSMDKFPLKCIMSSSVTSWGTKVRQKSMIASVRCAEGLGKENAAEIASAQPCKANCNASFFVCIPTKLW